MNPDKFNGWQMAALIVSAIMSTTFAIALVRWLT